MYKQTNKQQTENTLELFEMQMIGIKHLSDMLRMSDMDKIKLTHDVFKANGVPTKALPIYVDTENHHYYYGVTEPSYRAYECR